MPKFAHLFRGFRSDLRALLPLGVVFLGGMLVAVQATTLIDGGQLIALLSGTERPTEAVLEQRTSAGGDAFRRGVRAADAARDLVRAGAGRIQRRRSAHRAGDEPAGVSSPIGARSPSTDLPCSLSAGSCPSLRWASRSCWARAPQDPCCLFVITPYMFVLIATLHISDYVGYRDIFPATRQAQTPAATSSGRHAG